MAHSELQAVAFEDDLTGLYNRRFVEHYLSTQVDWKGSAPTSFVLLDIDAFHRANDKFAREDADFMLFSFAKRLEAAVRAEDTVARDSGDSFFLILPNVAKADAAATAAKIVESLVTEPLHTRKDRFKIDLTASAGVVSFPEDGGDPEAVRKAAERVLFHAKRTGRNRVSVGGQIDEQVAAEQDLFSGLPCRSFCGRKAELAAAAGLLEDLAAKKSPVLLVQGMAGVGKSRFIKEVAARAGERRILYLYAMCSESYRQSPGHALIFLVDQYYRLDPGALMEFATTLFPAQRNVAREFIPAFASLPAEQVSIPPRDRKPLLLGLLETALNAMAKRTPMLILIDNAGFADGGTLDILRRTIKGGAAPLAALLAIKEDVRGKESPAGPEFAAFLAELRRLNALQALSLPPLSRDDGAAMIRAILAPSEVPPSFETLILSKSGGNPLFIEESIRSLILKKKLERKGDRFVIPVLGPADVPDSLQGLIEQSLSTLSAEAGELVTNAAILGTRFDLQELQEVMGKREGETLDAVDQVKNLKLIEQLDRGRSDDFAFRSTSSREVRFTTTSDDVRRRLESRRAGVVRSKSVMSTRRLALPPLGARTLPPAAPPPPAHALPEGTVVGRPPRIPEGSAPLSPAAAKAAADFARALGALLKIGRLYPQWSQTSAQFAQQMHAAAQVMVADAAAVTFSSDPKAGLLVNGRPADAGARNDVFADFEGLLTQRLIAALTLAQGLESRELEALVQALSAGMDRSRTAADHWDRFLDGNAIVHFDIRQRRYVALEADRSTMVAGGGETGAPPSPQDLEELRLSLRSFKAAADNLHLYPPGHALVEQALADTVRGFTALCGRLRAVALAPSSDGLLVNGTPTDARAVGDGGTWLADQLSRRQLGAMTLATGLRPEEIQALVSAFSIPPDDPSYKAILAKSSAEGETAHVRFGALVYAQVGADARGTVQSGVISSRPTSTMPAPSPASAAPAQPEEPVVEFDTLDDDPASTGITVRADIRARVYLKAPTERFLAVTLEDEIAPLLEVLSTGWMETLAFQLVDRLCKFTIDPEPPHRGEALKIMVRGLRGLKTLKLRTAFIGRVQEALLAVVTAENDPGVLTQACATIGHWLDAALALYRFQAASELLGRIQQRLEAKNLPPAFIANYSAVLARQTAPDGSLTKALRDPGVRLSALKIAGRFGPPVAPLLVEMLADSDDGALRRAAAAALNEIGGNASELLAREVRPEADARRIVRVLQTIDRIQPLIVETPIAVAMRYEHASVHEALVELVRRLEKGRRIASLRTAANSHPTDTMRLATELAIDDVVPEAIRLLQSSTDERILRAACLYLAAFPNPLAVPGLRRIVENRSKLFGMVKGFSDDLRAAAVTAAKTIRVEESRRLIGEAKKDRSEAVRAAAEAP